MNPFIGIILIILIAGLLIPNGIHALELDVWAPSAVSVGTSDVEIGCKYSNSQGQDVRITLVELQKEWPRGKGKFQIIAEFDPSDVAGPSFSFSSVAVLLENRTALVNMINDSNSVKLIIDDIECEDEGTYRCSVHFNSNSASGTVYKTVTMKTTVKGKAPYAAPLSSRSGGLAENESVNFTCKADLGKPPGSIGWWLYRRNKDTPQDLTNAAIETPDSEGDPGICDNIVISTLPFKLDKDDNHAVIRCTVNQELLSSPTGKPQDMPYKQTDMLRVFYEVRKPEITKKPNALVYDVDTQSLTIQCFTIGNPNPFTTNDERKGKVTWYYKRSSDSNDILASQVPNIKITRREVVLQKLSESQAGIYTCEVRNRFKGIDYVQRSEVLIKIESPNNVVTTKTPTKVVATENPNHVVTTARIVNDNKGVSGIAVSIAGDSVIILFLLGIVFMIYREGRRSLKKGKYESFPGLRKKVSTMDHVYVDAEDIRNKKHVTMDIH